MVWCTAGTSKKPWHSRQSFKHDWRNAAWKCTRRKPRSPTARDGNRQRQGILNIQFDFLGYGFRPRLVRRSRDNTLFWGFNPAVSASALKAMRAAIRELNLRHRTDLLAMDEIARQIKSAPTGLDRILRAIRALGAVSFASNTSIRCFWPGRCGSSSASQLTRSATSRFLQKLAQEKAGLFVHSATGHDRYVRLMGAV